MFYYLVLFLTFLLVLYILFLASMRIYHPFWSIQPVYHFYDLKYLWKSGVIDKNLPEKNRYVNITNVEVKNIKDITNYELKKSVYFIQDHYLNLKDIVYKPSIKNISSYFENHNDNCYFSFYKKVNYLVEKKSDDVLSPKEIIGLVTSRPIYLHFFKKSKQKSLNVYYIDYLCLHKDHRNKNIVPELLQTHEYKQRRLNRKVNVCLFKREDHIMFIMPIVLYNAYCYEMKNIINKPLKQCYKCKLINNKNSNLMLNLLDKIKNKFSLFAIVSLSNILTLIENKVYYVYVLIYNNEAISLYFYRDTMVYYNNKPTVELFASICNCNIDLFYFGFIKSYINISKYLKAPYLILEELSHNVYLNKYLENNENILFKTPYSYYLFNYSSEIYKKEKVCIII